MKSWTVLRHVSHFKRHSTLSLDVFFIHVQSVWISISAGVQFYHKWKHYLIQIMTNTFWYVFLTLVYYHRLRGNFRSCVWRRGGDERSEYGRGIEWFPLLFMSFCQGNRVDGNKTSWSILLSIWLKYHFHLDSYVLYGFAKNGLV